mmetsp:Transcript_39049/g.125525  ORF Transcript_39049/g.125525 Transcript_39049/m.125525 type:complete len:1029 (-) Transcript_39049:93-3179(-)
MPAGLQKLIMDSGGESDDGEGIKELTEDKLHRLRRHASSPMKFRHVFQLSLRCALLTLLAGGLFFCMFLMPSDHGDFEAQNAAKVSRAEAEHQIKGKSALVTELYTFGAPGSAREPLIDETDAEGCFPGLRIYSAAMRPGLRYDVPVADPIAWITAQFNYTHPKMKVLEVWETDIKDNPVSPCASDANVPPRDDFWWTTGHTVYEDILRAHVEYLHEQTGSGGGVSDGAAAADGARADAARRLRSLRELAAAGSPQLEAVLPVMERAFLMVHFAFMIYQDSPQKLALDAQDLGWSLVGLASVVTAASSPFGSDSRDRASLYQHPVSLECVLAFEGTDRKDPSDWYSDIDAASSPFCEMAEAHHGFKHKLMRMVSSADYREAIRSNLGYCSALTVTGHSMGGSQAELFAACANRQPKVTDPVIPDFELISFTTGIPKRLPDFYLPPSPGQFFRNLETGKCLDVRGTMQTQSDTPVDLYDCETPWANYSKDQRWKMSAEGHFVNELSGMCMAVDNSVDPPVLVQRVCENSTQVGQLNQTWELTTQRFLRNKKSGLCVDSLLDIVQCPYNDMKWRRMEADGRLVSNVSGLCVDVQGSPGVTPNAPLLLWPCELAAGGAAANGTDERWTIEADGRVRNTLSGLCVHSLLNNENSKEELVLGECSEENATNTTDLHVEMLLNGFIRSRSNGLCVDARGSLAEKGASVVLAPCRHGGATGEWKLDPGGFVRNVGSDWDHAQGCMEIFGTHDTGEKLMDGARLHLDVCEVGTDQRWYFKGGSLKNGIGARKCLDIKQSYEDDKHELMLSTCAEWMGVFWEFGSDFTIRSTYADRCIGVLKDAEKTGGRRQVKAVSCSSLKEDALIDVWQLFQSGSIIDTSSGKCLSFVGDQGVDANPVLALLDCGSTDPSVHQRWDWADNLLKPRSGRQRHACVGFDDRGSENGDDQADLVVKMCPEMSQTWEHTMAQHIFNPDVGVCLDVQEETSSSSHCTFFDRVTGACEMFVEGEHQRLMTAQCDPMRTRQRWELLDGRPPA